jgi:hypothetical protein
MIIQQAGLQEAHPFILYQNLLADPGTVILPQTTAPGFSGDSLATENTYQRWKAGAVQTFVEVDFGYAAALDTFAIAAHNLGKQTSIGYKLNAMDAYTYVYNSPLVEGEPFAYLFSAPVSARFVILGTFNFPLSAPLPLVGVFSVGLRLKLPAWVAPDYARSADAVTVEGSASLSRGGQFLGSTIRRQAGRLPVQFSPIERAWTDANLGPFRDHYNRRRPFFFASSPTKFADDLAYSWRADDAPEMRPQLMRGGESVSVSMDMAFHVA